MIHYVSGKLVEKTASYLVVDVQGLGYLLKISLQTFQHLNQTGEFVKINTFLHVKEDSHTLYGFFEESERQLFIDLISVSGIGPSTAMVMLSSLSTTEIIEAIVNEDLKTVQSIKGIGGKTAGRVLLELKDKLKKQLAESDQGFVAKQLPTYALKSEALLALTTLGIARTAAEKSIDVILKTQGNNITLENLIKLALR